MDQDIFNQKPHHRAEYINKLHTVSLIKDNMTRSLLNIDLTGGFQLLNISLLNVLIKERERNRLLTGLNDDSSQNLHYIILSSCSSLEVGKGKSIFN